MARGSVPSAMSADSLSLLITPTNTPALACLLEFVRRRWRETLGISITILVPCFWHRHIAAGDLGSHVYNAWLVQLIERGELPGLSIARQWNNVLFDFLLSELGKLLPLPIAERVAVSVCVLIFFWGSFALVAASSDRAPWTLSPCLAMLSYGWIFHVGFFNYYLSLGLSFWGLALFWRGGTWERMAALGLSPLIFLAHPFGAALLIAGAAYIFLDERLPQGYRLLPLAATMMLLLLTNHYIWHHWRAFRTRTPLYSYNGVDQFVIFGGEYRWLAGALLLLALLVLALELVGKKPSLDFWDHAGLPLRLYVAIEMAIVLLPNYIHLPQYALPLSGVTARLTSISALFSCCILNAIRAHKWHFAGYTAIAAVFFTLLYRDTATVNRMEEKVEQLIGLVQPGSVVVSDLWHPPGSRVPVEHIVDRACIGFCFSYSNYEPVSRQFRVRADPGNRFVNGQIHFNSEEELRLGIYTIDVPRPPAYRIYLCGADKSDVCIRPVQSMPLK